MCLWLALAGRLEVWGLETSYSHMWWWMVCLSTKISWGSGLEHHVCVSSRRGLGFLTIWWLDSKGEPTEREPGRPCVKIDRTKPWSCVVSLMLSPFVGAVTSPFPDSRGGNIDAISTWSRASHTLKKARNARDWGERGEGRKRGGVGLPLFLLKIIQ